MFGRRKKGSPEPDAADERLDDADRSDLDPADEAGYEDAEYDYEDEDEDAEYEEDPDHEGEDVGRVERADGPFDVSEIDPEEAEGPLLLDLGGLRLPVQEGIEVRLDVDQASGQVVSATVVDGASAVQVSAFAAPRTEGIWDDVRGEIAAGISAAGGTVDQVAGSFGRELHAMVPADPAAKVRGLVPARFVGVDGPRWFVRGLFTGPAAREPGAADRLETVLRGCIVVRGGDPMAPGDVLHLHVPTELPAGLARSGEDGPAEDGVAGGGAASADDRADDRSAEGATSPDRRRLPPPRRGPEITEIR